MKLKLLFLTAIAIILLTFVKVSGPHLLHGRTELSGQATASPLFVWVVSSLARVGPTDPPTQLQTISISGARGEIVDTQLVVRASNALTSLNVSQSALTGPNGAKIPESSIIIYREHYVKVTGTAMYGGGSNRPLGSGVYPEPLIPFNDPATGLPLCPTHATLKACNVNVSAGTNQPFWIDISVPRGTAGSPPGNYTGSITVSSDQATVAIPVILTVWNFELPTQPSEPSLLTLWPPATGNTLESLNQALARNKAMGFYGVPSSGDSEFARLGVTRSALNFLTPVEIRCTGSSRDLPETDQINAAAAKFPSGIALDLYVGDELNECPGAYAALRTIGTRSHSSNFNVGTILTTNAPDPSLFDEGDGRSAIDHWVLLDSVQRWPALPFTGKGDLWSYTSCNTGFGNTPEWMVDYPLINERIQAGFLNWTQGATEILYYRADGWTAGNTLASWNDVNTTTCGGGLGRPGDGILVYPPGPIASSEPAPGMRLKAIRDGIQDYEYARALRDLGHERFVDSILRPIATSWSNWSHDPTLLEQARQQLGRRFDQIARNTKSGSSGSHF